MQHETLKDISADAAMMLHFPPSVLTRNHREDKAAPVQASTTPCLILHTSTSDRPVMNNRYFSNLS